MSTSLRQRLNELASSFASQVLDAIRGASMKDLLASLESDGLGASRGAGSAAQLERGRARPLTGRSTGRLTHRLPRRSADDIANVVEKIVSLLKQNPKGMRAEQIREKLALEAKELPRPLKESLDSGRVSKSGQKRATTYVAKGVGSSVASSVKRRAESPGRAQSSASRGVRAFSSRNAGTRGQAARGRGTAPAGAGVSAETKPAPEASGPAASAQPS